MNSSISSYEGSEYETDDTASYSDVEETFKKEETKESNSDYDIPKPPDLIKYTKPKDHKYFCDNCFKTQKILCGGMVEKRCTSAGATTRGNLILHYETPKHMKTHLALINSTDKICCKFCDEDFTPDGYERHKQRNKDMWGIMEANPNHELIAYSTCNNFKFNNKRFHSYDSMKRFYMDWQDYKERKKKYNKYIRTIRNGEARKQLHSGIKDSILGNYKNKNLGKYN
tara:strand:+ start:2513 stop:3193 length:681 start_codon:yes stop_codon:yes gene_type:complete